MPGGSGKSLEEAQKPAYLQELLKIESDYQGFFLPPSWPIGIFRQEKPNLVEWEKSCGPAGPARTRGRFAVGDLTKGWHRDGSIRSGATRRLLISLKRQVYIVPAGPAAAPSQCRRLVGPFLEFPAEKNPCRRPPDCWPSRPFSTTVGNSTTDWDRLMPYVQSGLAREDYMAAASLASGMLANITSVEKDVARVVGTWWPRVTPAWEPSG
ncbi:MAG: hypothetical protein Ct9H300mP1_17420 [Planctomycetaceae bacterium]|nr:MAG: hypothetical protein Ct9H300mP1_17420 [Planctomycetaceae bacterium]